MHIFSLQHQRIMEKKKTPFDKTKILLYWAFEGLRFFINILGNLFWRTLYKISNICWWKDKKLMIKSIYSNTKIHFFNILKTHIFKTLILFYNVFLLHEMIKFLALLWKYDKKYDKLRSLRRLGSALTCSWTIGPMHVLFIFMSFLIFFFCCRLQQQKQQETGKSKSIEIFDGYSWTLLEHNLSFGRAGHCPVRIRNYDFPKICKNPLFLSIWTWRNL